MLWLWNINSGYTASGFNDSSSSYEGDDTFYQATVITVHLSVNVLVNRQTDFLFKELELGQII